MANFCSNCGAKVSENAKFCNECGKTLNGAVENVDAARAQGNSSRADIVDKVSVEIFENCAHTASALGTISFISSAIGGFLILQMNDLLESSSFMENFISTTYFKIIIAVILCALILPQIINAFAKLNSEHKKSSLAFKLLALQVSTFIIAGAPGLTGSVDFIVKNYLGESETSVLGIALIAYAIISLIICIIKVNTNATAVFQRMSGRIPTTESRDINNKPKSDCVVNDDGSWQCTCGATNPKHAASCKTCGKYK